MKQAVKGDPAHSSTFNGQTFLFSNAEAKAMFDKDKAGTIAKADANWPKIEQGN